VNIVIQNQRFNYCPICYEREFVDLIIAVHCKNCGLYPIDKGILDTKFLIACLKKFACYFQKNQFDSKKSYKKIVSFTLKRFREFLNNSYINYYQETPFPYFSRQINYRFLFIFKIITLYDLKNPYKFRLCKEYQKIISEYINKTISETIKDSYKGFIHKLFSFGLLIKYKRKLDFTKDFYNQFYKIIMERNKEREKSKTPSTQLNYQNEEIKKKSVLTSIKTDQIADRKYCENGKIALDYYAKIIVKKYKDKIRERRKALGFLSVQKRLSKMEPIRHDQVKNINKIASKNGRIKYFWFGLVYQITTLKIDGTDDKKYAGMTALTLNHRWRWYGKSALIKPEHWHYPVIKQMRKVLFDETGYIEEDLKINNMDWNWVKINAILDKRFKREVKIICFNSKSLKQEEKKYIQKHNLIQDGLNIREGGEGGHAIDLPMFRIAKMIAKGMGLKEMKKNINWVSFQTIWARINDYWSSYDNSIVLFLRPMLQLLITSGFELHEINDAYGRFMHDAIKTLFGGYSFRQLQDLKEDQWDSLNYEYLPSRTITGQINYVIPINKLKNLILRHKTAISAVNDPLIDDFLSIYSEDAGRQQIIYQIQQQLDYKDWIDARRHIAGNFIIKSLREGNLTPKQIYIHLGYDEPSAESHTTLTQIYFSGLSTENLIEILMNNNLINNYTNLEKFIENLKYQKAELTKSKIDELLLRNLKSKNMIKGLAGWTTGDFLNEVNKYYPNFKQAKWIVKFPYIAKKIRMLSLPYNPKELKTILMEVGYSEKTAYSAVFRDMLFKMGVIDAIAFLNYYPEINTYPEAVAKLKEISGAKYLFTSRTTKIDTLRDILNSLENEKFKTIKQISNETGFLKRTIRGYLTDLTNQKMLEQRVSNGVSQWRLIGSDQKIEDLLDDSSIEYPWNEDPNFILKEKIKPLRKRT